VNVAVVSYRLGGADGVSAEAAKWIRAFRSLGCSVTTVAGDGVADVIEPGLGAGPALAGTTPPPPDEDRLRSILAHIDLVVVENLCSLPLNPLAAAAVARVLRGRPAILRHHDLPWQREAFADAPPPSDDPAWCHVVTIDRSRLELRQHGIDALTVRNLFDPRPPYGDRKAVRKLLGVSDGELLVVQPTRAIARKNIPQAVALAEALGAHYWIVGRAEEGYEPTLRTLLARASVPTYWGTLPGLISATDGIEHAYAAADIVAFPSTCEGFGNPPVEASLHLRPVAVGRYGTGQELRALGFKWLDANDHGGVADWLAQPQNTILLHNRSTARTHLNLHQLPRYLAGLIRRVGIAPPRLPVHSAAGSELSGNPSRRASHD
jgi:mannosylglucosylglycerate synthase